MNDTTTTGTGTNPFSPRIVLALVLFGSIVFVALLWMIGAGLTSGSANDGGSHAAGKGLNGYAAVARLLDARGFEVRQSRNEGTLDNPGLLILTPPHVTDGEELDRIVGSRQIVGPTLVVVPKWVAAPTPPGTPGAKKGWVFLGGSHSPEWTGFRDDVAVGIREGSEDDKADGWRASGLSGLLPTAKAVQWGSGENLVPLVRDTKDGRILAAYIDDGGAYPTLDTMALEPRSDPGGNEHIFPLIFVFEPDLLNNYGMSNAANAKLAEKLIRAAAGDSGAVNFDLTLNGHARSTNLLTLAFTPPFLAATLCLLLAAIAVGWRAFLRFGAPKKPGRAIAFGKSTLVANSAGLIRRARRLHLIAGPYADRTRERLAGALALSQRNDARETEVAIDRVLERLAPEAPPFSETAQRLRNARKPHDLLKAARDLHSLERKLIR